MAVANFRIASEALRVDCRLACLMLHTPHLFFLNIFLKKGFMSSSLDSGFPSKLSSPLTYSNLTTGQRRPYGLGQGLHFPFI